MTEDKSKKSDRFGKEKNADESSNDQNRLDSDIPHSDFNLLNKAAPKTGENPISIENENENKKNSGFESLFDDKHQTYWPGAGERKPKSKALESNLRLNQPFKEDSSNPERGASEQTPSPLSPFQNSPSAGLPTVSMSSPSLSLDLPGEFPAATQKDPEKKEPSGMIPTIGKPPPPSKAPDPSAPLSSHSPSTYVGPVKTPGEFDTGKPKSSFSFEESTAAGMRGLQASVNSMKSKERAGKQTYRVDHFELQDGIIRGRKQSKKNIFPTLFKLAFLIGLLLGGRWAYRNQEIVIKKIPFAEKIFNLSGAIGSETASDTSKGEENSNESLEGGEMTEKIRSRFSGGDGSVSKPPPIEPKKVNPEKAPEIVPKK